NEDITREIEEEDDEHQLFYQIASDLNLTVAYEDADGNNNPVGLLTTITTGDASTGTLTVTLRHEPAKDASGVSDGDIANAGGETDIEVIFDVEIQ
ncbi:MAG: type 1 periplasmic binding fold superfamily protein, partial [Bacteroidota bacterium]